MKMAMSSRMECTENSMILENQLLGYQVSILLVAAYIVCSGKARVSVSTMVSCHGNGVLLRPVSNVLRERNQRGRDIREKNDGARYSSNGDGGRCVKGR